MRQPEVSWRMEWLFTSPEYNIGVCWSASAKKVSLVSELGVEGHFDSLDLMTEFDGRAKL